MCLFKQCFWTQWLTVWVKDVACYITKKQTNIKGNKVCRSFRKVLLFFSKFYPYDTEILHVLWMRNYIPLQTSCAITNSNPLLRHFPSKKLSHRAANCKSGNKTPRPLNSPLPSTYLITATTVFGFLFTLNLPKPHKHTSDLISRMEIC